VGETDLKDGDLVEVVFGDEKACVKRRTST
jgi:hypothetical protein